MHQIFAGRVPPMHVGPVPAVRVVLVKHVILTVEIYEAIRIVIPAAPGGEMELRTERLAIQIVRVFYLRCLVDRTQSF